MRITGGIARGIQLALPTRGEIRPATDYLREAVFSSLSDLIDDANILDCFAGTGAYSWESLSRGAKSAILIDKNSSAIVAQKKNFALVKKSLESRTERVPSVCFLSADLLSSRASVLNISLMDIIFCDPPWALWQKSETTKLVEKLTAFARTDSAGTRIVLEAPADFEVPVPAGWKLLKKIGKKGKDQPAANLLSRDEE